MLKRVVIYYECDACGRPEAVTSQHNTLKLPVNWTDAGRNGKWRRHKCWDCSEAGRMHAALKKLTGGVHAKKPNAQTEDPQEIPCP